MTKVSNLLGILIVVLSICHTPILAQNKVNCPSGQKPSLQLPSKCVPSNSTFCDGWNLKGTQGCTYYDITVPPQYGQTSVNCILATGSDASISLYICRNCTASAPFGFDCNSCKSDEYTNFIPPSVGCIKKVDFYFPQYSGYLTVDKTTIIPECLDDQYYEEYTTSSQLNQNDLLIVKSCKQCQSPTPYSSADQTKCVTSCNKPGYVLDIRVTPNKCIKTKDCNTFVSADATTCTNTCNPGEGGFSKSQYKACYKCPTDKPFTTADKKSCVENCGQGLIYGEKEKVCIPIASCTGFVSDSNKLICLEKSCVRKQSGMSPAQALVVNKPAGQNYQTCKICQLPTPFLDEKDQTKCIGCSEVTNYTTGSCGTMQNIGYIGNLSADEKSFYPESYCPPGQYRVKGSLYYKCTNCGTRQFPSPSLNFCCSTDSQFYNEMTQRCYDRGVFFNECGRIGGIPSADGKICFKQCPKGQYNNSFFCSNCGDEASLQNENSSSCQEQVQCLSNEVFSEKQKKCIPTNECDGYLYTSTGSPIVKESCQTAPCPSFDVLNQIPNYLTEKLNNASNGMKCVQCPPDKPFIQLPQFNSESPQCTRCADKIRDYDTGRCVSSIDKINNPGTGVFFFSRLEYWPKAAYQKKIKCSTLASFKFNDLGLKECVEEMKPPCKISEIYDERKKTCISSSFNCSTFLSNDKKTCSLTACKPDEVFISVTGNLSIQYELYGNNGGYLQYCIKCPSNKPLKQADNTCDTVCPSNKMINIGNTQCIDKKECALAKSDKQTQCVTKCQRGEISAYDNINQNYYCSPCNNKQQYIYNKTSCIDECPKYENLVLSVADLECIPKQNCNGQISKSGKTCLDICPLNMFFDSQKAQCISSCGKDLVHNTETLECQSLQNCMRFIDVASNYCINDCPKPQVYMEIQLGNNQSYKKCMELCPEGYYGDSLTRECKSWSTCSKTLSPSKQQCVDSCPLGYGKSPEKLNSTSQYINMCLLFSQSQYNNIYTQDGKCTSNCYNYKILDLETKNCIEESNCKNNMSFDRKQCEKTCIIGTPVLSDQAPYINYCKCPEDKPYVDNDQKPTTCVDKCKIYDNTGKKSYKVCILEIQNCKGVLKASVDGESQECLSECPKSYTTEKICTPGNICFNMCKPCPNDSNIIFENKCIDKCPPSLTYYSDVHSCFNDKCEYKQIFDIKTKKCVSWRECDLRNGVVDLDNFKCVDQCPQDYQHYIKGRDSCGEELNAKSQSFFPDDTVCLYFDQKGTFNSCSSEKLCQPPRIQIQFEGKTMCVYDLTSYGFVFDKFLSNKNTYYGVEPRKCKGVVSYDGQQCKVNCDDREFKRKDEKGGFLKCTPCYSFLQYSQETGDYECLEKCKDGYISNSNKMCILYVSECTENKIISSDGQYCTKECIFPDYKSESGKCIKWQSTNFNFMCNIDEVLDTTTLPPYKCIPQSECKQSILGRRCVVTCNDVTCFNVAINKNFKITQNVKQILDQIQLNAGIYTIESLNRAIMSLDWFAIYVSDLLIRKQELSTNPIQILRSLLKNIIDNEFLQQINHITSASCSNYYTQIGSNLYAPSNKLLPLNCRTYKRLNQVQLNYQQQPLVFGRFDKIQVGYQQIQSEYNIKQLIDTTQFGIENISFEYNGEYDFIYKQNKTNPQIFTVYINTNPFCAEDDSSCKGYPLFYLDVSPQVQQLQIKFSLQSNSIKKVCAYYRYNPKYQSDDISFKPGCLTEDSKFIICPFYDPKEVFSFFSVQEDVAGDKVSQIQPICSKETTQQLNTKTVTQNLEQGRGKESLNIDVDKVIKSSTESCEEESKGGLSNIETSIITAFAIIIFQISVIGAYLVLRKYKTNKSRQTNQVKIKEEAEIIACNHYGMDKASSTHLKESDIQTINQL